jgi:predicted O-methyltransferase YrrM
VGYFGLTRRNLAPLNEKNNFLKVIANDSLSEVIKYADHHFDIVYIDAAHEYEPVKADIAAWLSKVKVGGIICGDDYVSGWPGVVQAVNEAFPAINRVGGQQWWVEKH